MNVPEGYMIEVIDRIPQEVLEKYSARRWHWLRALVGGMEVGEARRISCPDRKQTKLAQASLQNTKLAKQVIGKDKRVITRTAMKNGAVDDQWYLYIQVADPSEEK